MGGSFPARPSSRVRWVSDRFGAPVWYPSLGALAEGKVIFSSSKVWELFFPQRFWERIDSPGFWAAILGGCRSSGRGSRRSLHSAAPCAREPFFSVLEVP